ncbi:MAG: bifunctional DNA primase/polymerase, partial [Chlamydiia bacterium]|nr:bifunctional DNA primase/polymerase [Chlamydiia bacterium]
MNTLEAARSYVARGFSVIPIRANGKRPAEDWEQYQHTLPTGEQLTEWFDTTDLNIGIVTGAVSGIYVIDVDTYKGTD